jgi:hypothetical protein
MGKHRVQARKEAVRSISNSIEIDLRINPLDVGESVCQFANSNDRGEVGDA